MQHTLHCLHLEMLSCHLSTFWWVETDRKILTLHRVGGMSAVMYNARVLYVCALAVCGFVCACVRACARMHVFVRACGCVGGRRSWHSGIWKGDFHSRQTVEAEIWLAGEYPLHSVCVSSLFDYELSSARLKWTDTLLQVWREITDNLFLIFAWDSRTSYTVKQQ